MHRPRLPDLPKAPRSFHLLSKPTGAICNLNCSYCFFLSKEQLYPDSPFRMTDQLLETYIRQLLESHRDQEVTVAWQGGEPTMMRLPFFARSVELVQKHKRPDQRIEYTIQTNGTLLDDEWGAFLKEQDFLVGISIDGPREIHDTYRVDKGGKPTFDRVMAGLDVLNRHEVRWNALTTVHRANEAHGLAVYRFLRDDLGAQFAQFIPIVERASNGPIPHGDQVTERSVSPQGYGRFLVEVFEEWVRRDVGRVYVQMFDTSLANWLGVSGALCVHSETCGTAVALEHNGDVYSCDHFVEPDYLLGNIEQTHLLDLVASPRQLAFGHAKRDRLPAQCLSCDVRFACHGGCPKDRFTRTADGEPGLHYLCASYLEFFRHVDRPMRFMASRLRVGGHADDVMAWYARLDAKARSKADPRDDAPSG